MNIIVTNNPSKIIYSDSYDKVIYLGFTPEKGLEHNEIVVLDKEKHELDNYIISTKGVTNGHRIPVNKSDFLNHFKKDVNQIFLNDRSTNTYDEVDGCKHYYVAKNGHYEIEI